MSGASARYSCFGAPVETSTPPRWCKIHSVWGALTGIPPCIPLRLHPKSQPLRWVAIWGRPAGGVAGEFGGGAAAI